MGPRSPTEPFPAILHGPTIISLAARGDRRMVSFPPGPLPPRKPAPMHGANCGHSRPPRHERSRHQSEDGSGAPSAARSRPEPSTRTSPTLPEVHGAPQQ